MERKINWGSLLIGILSLILGVFALYNPDTTLSSIVIFAGVFAIIYGVATFMINYNIRKEDGSGGIFEMIIAILEVVIGIYFLFNISIGLLALPIIFAIWFMIDVIKDMIFTRILKPFNKTLYNFLLGINIVRIVVGIMLIYNPLATLILTVYLVGFNFILTGIKSIILAFYNR